jgi:hypothetical protein
VPLLGGVDDAVEVLDRAADLVFLDDFDEAGAAQLGDVVVDRAERGPQLEAEVFGGEDSTAVDAQYFKD